MLVLSLLTFFLIHLLFLFFNLSLFLSFACPPSFFSLYFFFFFFFGRLNVLMSGFKGFWSTHTCRYTIQYENGARGGVHKFMYLEFADKVSRCRRQRQINSSTSTPFSLAQRHLPRELLQELRIPPPPPLRKRQSAARRRRHSDG